MKRSAAKHTPREIAELLESDDEIPDSYDETPDIPAYLNDNRFTKVKPVTAKLIERTEEIYLPPKLVQHQSSTCKEPVETISTKLQICPQEQLMALVPEQTKRTLNKNKTLISKGILTKRDIFLVKSIEEFATESTLMWFIDFLNNKEVRSHQRSCLVANLTDEMIIPLP